MKNQLQDSEINYDNEERDQQAICLFCSAVIAHMNQHIAECPKISLRDLSEKPTFFKIGQKGNLCKRCGNLFSPKDWQYHRRTQQCKKQIFRQAQSSKNRMINKDGQIRSESKAIAASLYGSGSVKNFSLPQMYQAGSISCENSKRGYYSEGNASLRGREQYDSNIGNLSETRTSRQLLDVGSSLLAPFIDDWTKRNQHIDVKVLIAYFSSSLLQFSMDFFLKQVIQPTWAAFRKVSKDINWERLLEKPGNIFNDKYVDLKLSAMTPAKQAKIIKALNKLSDKLKGPMKKRELPSVQRQSRQKKFVRIKDIILLIKDLLLTKRRRAVHLGLDLYVILLSGMRFKSDKLNIQKSVLEQMELNRNRHQNDIQLTYDLDINKTSVRQIVCLNRQLMLMLLDFQWTGFLDKTQRLVARMNEWLGVNGYTFKNVIMNAASAAAPDLTLAQRIAGHQSIESTKKYTLQSMLNANLELAKKIVVPGMNMKYGSFNEEQVVHFLDSLSYQNIRYCSFRENWKHQLFSRLYTQRFIGQINRDDVLDLTNNQQPALSYDPQAQNSFQKMNQADQPSQKEVKVTKPARQLNRRIEDKNNEMIPQLQYDLRKLEQIVIIYGFDYVFAGGHFQQSDFFQPILSQHDVDCNVCLASIAKGLVRMRCNFCLGHSHQQCSPRICACVTFSDWLPRAVPPTLVSYKPTSQIAFKMPQEYVSQTTSSKQAEIKTLLALRRFKYTRVAVQGGHQVRFPSNFGFDLQITQVEDYYLYEQGRYMPPIEIRPLKSFQKHQVFGTQFGIFATQHIPKGVLIGEYAADLMNGYQLQICKKGDSIMSYTGGTTPQDVFVAPKDFAGYVLLVNTGNGFTNNCSTLRTIINGIVRIVLYTNKNISKGEELLYQYGENYQFNNLHFDSSQEPQNSDSSFKL